MSQEDPSARSKAETLVFVYGSLLRGESNHQYLAGARYVGGAETAAAFALFDLGGFPAMVADGDGVVRGEIYACDKRVIHRLDELGDHPEYFRRTRIELADGTPLEAYLLSGAHASAYPRIASGDWRQRFRAGA